MCARANSSETGMLPWYFDEDLHVNYVKSVRKTILMQTSELIDL